MRTSYDGDVVAWANEQAMLLRAGRFSELDIEHLVDEVEDVGKSEQRELASRMSVLLMHLLKWDIQPERRCKSWVNTIKDQRRLLQIRLVQMPSLKPMFNDPAWLEVMWIDAVVAARKETGVEEMPESCGWTIQQIMDNTFFPD